MVAISTDPDPEGTGRVNILTHRHITAACAIGVDQGYGRGGTPVFTGVFEPLAREALYPTDEDCLGTWFGAA